MVLRTTSPAALTDSEIHGYSSGEPGLRHGASGRSSPTDLQSHLIK